MHNYATGEVPTETRWQETELVAQLEQGIQEWPWI
jgi:hypothetical protein